MYDMPFIPDVDDYKKRSMDLEYKIKDLETRVMILEARIEAKYNDDGLGCAYDIPDGRIPS